MSVLRYGQASSIRLELPDGVLAAECGDPPIRPLDDPAAAVAQALAEPLDYPPLARCTTPGDRVVVALDHGLPQVAQLTAAVVETVVDSGVDPDGIVVLQTPDDLEAGADDPCRLIAGPIRERMSSLIHDPSDRAGLAYLANTAAGEAILLNRALHEADLILPVGCLHGESAAGYYGLHGALFPAFSDQRTLERFRSPRSLKANGSYRKGLFDEADEVGWLLGINLTIQVVPGPGEAVLHVLAGHSESVARRGPELFAQAWSRPVPQRASLVVAAMEGGPRQQTWQSLGRSLATAAELIEDGGSIAVCCDLDAAPGPAIQQMIGAESREAALEQIRRERPVDALAAAQLAEAQQRGQVYLFSRLEASAVEDLDIIPLAAADELARLVRRHRSCILLSGAPLAMVQVKG